MDVRLSTLHRRSRRAPLAGLLGALAVVGLAPQIQARELQDLPVKPYWAQRVTGYLTTVDGVKLRYSVLLPKKSGRFPVIINYSGYDPGAIGGLAYRRGDSAMSPNLDRTLLEHGYAVMGVNARGTGCSEGEFDFLGPKYGEDGRDAVEFAATQAWSNGSVGMANWSWAGMSQIATASNRPPHLKAIAPGMVLGDPRLDSWAPGGVPAPAFIKFWRFFLHSRWEAVRQSAVDEHDGQCVAQIAKNLVGEEQNSITTMVAQHPLRDAWIQTRQLRDRTHLIQVPVLSMESFQDEAVTSREGYYQETLDQDRLWMVQTNGGHDLYESLRFRPTLLAFFDHFLKGETNGFEKRPHLEVWMDTVSDGVGEHPFYEAARPSWVFHRQQVQADVKPVAFAVQDSGRLSLEGAPEGTPDSYKYPLPGPEVDTGMGAQTWGPQPAEWKTGSVAYTSAPLKHDILTYGPGSADLYISSSNSDADVQVTLTEVRPDGQEVFIQRGWLRLSDHAIDAAKSTPTRPVLVDTPEAIHALVPDEPVLARVELNKFAYVFHKGARVRIWIDTPSFWGGYGFSYDPLPATNKVWHDSSHPSRLVLGELTDVTIPGDAASSCSHLKEPCRLDPLRPGHQ
ncbi:MAG TPA: CocE/NonD family hydrolase [Steroidobacteraceae bacterium]|nr:CocE/NonD family hydrolase [Steroidobacteraceae bacterium]